MSYKGILGGGRAIRLCHGDEAGHYSKAASGGKRCKLVFCVPVFAAIVPLRRRELAALHF